MQAVNGSESDGQSTSLPTHTADEKLLKYIVNKMPPPRRDRGTTLNDDTDAVEDTVLKKFL